jgi:mRNA interferase MazF
VFKQVSAKPFGLKMGVKRSIWFRIMAITSQTKMFLEIGECLIKKWKEAGLLKPSAIKPAISTIEQKLVLKKLGVLSTDDLASLNITLKELLSFG